MRFVAQQLAELYRRGFALLLAAAYLPTMAAHHALHRLALGRMTPLVAGLMTLDALVVALIASCTGAAFALAYAATCPAPARI